MLLWSEICISKYFQFLKYDLKRFQKLNEIFDVLLALESLRNTHFRIQGSNIFHMINLLWHILLRSLTLVEEKKLVSSYEFRQAYPHELTFGVELDPNIIYFFHGIGVMFIPIPLFTNVEPPFISVHAQLKSGHEESVKNLTSVERWKIDLLI